MLEFFVKTMFYGDKKGLSFPQKGLILSLKNQSKFCLQQKLWQIFIWQVLDNHCCPRFDSQD